MFNKPIEDPFGMPAMRLLLRTFLHDRFLQALLFGALILSVFADFQYCQLAAAINWKTILTLTCLLLLTKGIESSGYFDFLGRKLIHHFSSQRSQAMLMVAASALLSTFLSNDVALFITVPLTLTLRKYSPLPINRLIIFEALAVNAGSLLTPIGNPQNILLWSQGNQGFFQFIWQMLPLTVLLIISLLILTFLSFSKQRVQFQEKGETSEWHKGLLLQCAALYLLFIIALEQNLAIYALLLVALFFACRAPRIFVSLDWSLLAVFILMFIDVFLIIRLPFLTPMLQEVPHWSQTGQFLLAIGLSQVISNVPATLILLNILPASPLLAWSVNIGGFGLLPGSLANLIALRMAGDRRIWWQFHLFSLPALFFASVAGGLLFLLIAAL